MLPFFLILESLNEIWASFDIFALRCCNKRQGRKLRPVWWQSTIQKRVKNAHKISIYSQCSVSLISQAMACSFYLCSPVRYTFSFQRASWAKRWNMTAKIAENDARTSQVDQFAVVTARPRLGTWSIVISPVEGPQNIWSYKLCLTHLPIRRTFVVSAYFFSFSRFAWAKMTSLVVTLLFPTSQFCNTSKEKCGNF